MAYSSGSTQGLEGMIGTRLHHRRSQAQGSSLEPAPYSQRVVGSSPDHVAKIFKIFMTQFTSSANWRFNDSHILGLVGLQEGMSMGGGYLRRPGLRDV